MTAVRPRVQILFFFLLLVVCQLTSALAEYEATNPIATRSASVGGRSGKSGNVREESMEGGEVEKEWREKLPESETGFLTLVKVREAVASAMPGVNGGVLDEVERLLKGFDQFSDEEKLGRSAHGGGEFDAHDPSGTFGSHKEVDLGGNISIVTSTSIGLIMLTLAIEGFTHRLEHRLIHHPHLLAMVYKLYRELMVLGLIAFLLFLVNRGGFGFFVAEELFDYDEDEAEMVEAIFELIHMSLFGMVILYVVQVLAYIIVTFRLSAKWDKAEKIGALGASSMLHRSQLERDSHNFLSWWMFHPRQSSAHTLNEDMVRYHTVRSRFLDQQGLPQSFNFARYMKRSTRSLFVALVEIHSSVWIILAILLMVNWARYKFITTYTTAVAGWVVYTIGWILVCMYFSVYKKCQSILKQLITLGMLTAKKRGLRRAPQAPSAAFERESDGPSTPLLSSAGGLPGGPHHVATRSEDRSAAVRSGSKRRKPGGSMRRKSNKGSSHSRQGSGSSRGSKGSKGSQGGGGSRTGSKSKARGSSARRGTSTPVKGGPSGANGSPGGATELASLVANPNLAAKLRVAEAGARGSLGPVHHEGDPMATMLHQGTDSPAKARINKLHNHSPGHSAQNSLSMPAGGNASPGDGEELLAHSHIKTKKTPAQRLTNMLPGALRFGRGRKVRKKQASTLSVKQQKGFVEEGGVIESSSSSDDSSDDDIFPSTFLASKETAQAMNARREKVQLKRQKSEAALKALLTEDEASKRHKNLFWFGSPDALRILIQVLLLMEAWYLGAVVYYSSHLDLNLMSTIGISLPAAVVQLLLVPRVLPLYATITSTGGLVKEGILLECLAKQYGRKLAKGKEIN